MVPHRPPLVRRHCRTSAKKQSRSPTALVLRVCIPQHNVVAKRSPSTRAPGPTLRAVQPERRGAVSGNTVPLHHVPSFVGELQHHPSASGPASIHTRHKRRRGLIADWRQHTPAVSHSNIVAKHHFIRRPEFERLPHIPNRHRVRHLNPLHPRVQQIQPVLKVVPPHVVVKNPITGRASRPEPVAVSTRFLITTFCHRHRMPHRKLLHAPSKLDHRAAHGQPAGHRDVPRVPGAVIHVDARIRNRPNVHTIQHHSNSRRPTDRRPGQPVQENIRIGNLAGQRRLLNPRLAIIVTPAASVREVAVSGTLSPVRHVKARHIDKLRILQIERRPTRKGDKQLRLRRITPAVRKVRPQNARRSRLRPRRDRRHRAVCISLAVHRPPTPRRGRLIGARRVQVHGIPSHIRPHQHRIAARDSPPHRVRSHPVRPKIPQAPHRARPIDTAPRIRRIVPPVALPGGGCGRTHKRRSAIRTHVPRSPSLTAGNHRDLDEIPRCPPAWKTAAAEARRPAPPAGHPRRPWRPCRQLPMPIHRCNPIVGARPAAHPLKRHSVRGPRVVHHNPRPNRHRGPNHHLQRQLCPGRGVLELPLIGSDVLRPGVARVLRQHGGPIPPATGLHPHIPNPYLPGSGVPLPHC